MQDRNDKASGFFFGGSYRVIFDVLRSYQSRSQIGAKGGTRTPTGVTRQILSLVRLPIPPLSHTTPLYCLVARW